MTRKSKKDEEKRSVPDGVDPKDVIPSRYWNLGSCSAAILSERLLPSLHKALLSKANVVGMMTKETAAQKQVLFLRLIEYLTGEGPSMQFGTDMRLWSKVQEYLRARCEERGRLTADLTLPPVYEEDGIYSIVATHDETDEVEVMHRFTREKRCITSECYMYPPEDLNTLKIIDNWSESRASLNYMDGSKKQRVLRLSGFFQQQFKKRGALCDLSPKSTPKKRRTSGSSKTSS
eukprot:6485439-Amphidinium_carterae.1